MVACGQMGSALQALDADLFVPYRNVSARLRFSYCAVASDIAVRRKCAHRQYIAFAYGEAVAEDFLPRFSARRGMGGSKPPLPFTRFGTVTSCKLSACCPPRFMS